MSKEHYITPEEFDRLVDKGILTQLAYKADITTDLKYMRRVIDALRPINVKDPGFKYSCECDDAITLWLFGYTIENVYKEALYKCKEIVKLNRTEREETYDHMIDYGFSNNATACSCPFDP